MILLGAASMRLRRRAASEAALETTLALERSTSAFALARAETKVDEEQEARRLVAEATDSLVLEVDKDGIVRSCSPAVERLLGYTAAELVGLEAYSLLHPDDLLRPQTDRSATPARTAATSSSKAGASRAATSSASSQASSRFCTTQRT